MNQTDKLNFIREKCIAALGGEDNNLHAFKIVTGDESVGLADVLLAIEYSLFPGTIEFSTYGDDFHIGTYEKPDREGYYKKAYWNLRADDLQKQSEETISFLYHLLK